ncbi:monovalent cation/H+ antiporter subunit D [Paracoccus endophyticus]|uniref:monovalent cation/H+ antiporter subunit D n=1 Tax=Paracoccus endophyticus TaxID=2233774 RepID=UPI000DDB9B57|nr:monovalent cation/H+ antiporter subunit D [Paracoccus endophyticus]
MNGGPEHLIVAPILIPLITGAVMMLYDERQRRTKLGLGLASCGVQLVIACLLLLRAEGTAATGGNAIGLYLLGNWPSPYGIVLVLDRLSAMMLVITGILALPAILYAGAGWHQRGQRFHALFQFLLMGLNGAFLTGDLFNLFVFFEVMLAASYALLLHGSGRERVGAGLHYIAVNLTASLMFLLGVAIIYGVTGTLNMADLATRIPQLSEADRPLIHGACAILGMVFLVKAGAWPLSLWLPGTYMAASAPVAAVFALLTKLGVYVILRLSLLVFGAGAGVSAGFGADVLIWGGMATVVFGMTGALAAQALGRMAANLTLVSSGTMLTIAGFALGQGDAQMLGAGLFYMLASTTALATLFLLAEPMSREQGAAAVLALSAELYGVDLSEDEPDPEPQVTGVFLPGSLTVLGLCFAACTLMLAGLPPLAGFLGKFGVLAGAIAGMGDATSSPARWVFVTLLLVSGLAAMIALGRIGMQTFWAAEEDLPAVPTMELLPIMALVIAGGLVLTVEAEPVMRYMTRTADALLRPEIYIHGVVTAPPVDARAGNGG